MRQLLLEIKKTNKIDSSTILNTMIFIKYIPIMIILNDWVILPQFGFYYILGKLTVGNLFRKLQNLEFVKITFTVLFTITLVSLLIIKLLYKRLNEENKEKFTKIILIISQFLFYVFYMFPTLIHQIIYINAAYDIKCSADGDNKDGIININTTNNYICNYDLDYINLCFSIFFMLLTIYLNYKFEVFFPNINSININQKNASEIKSINFSEIFSPLLHALILYEIFQFPSSTFIFIKLIFRILFILKCLISLKNLSFLENNFEFMLNYFGLFTSLTDFIFLKEFIGLSTREDIINLIDNPEAFSLIYSLKFQLVKIILGFCITACLHSFHRKFEINFLADFYNKTKSNDYFEYYCKLFKFVKNFDSYSGKDKFSFISNLHIKIKSHFQDCKQEFCTCELAIEIFQSFIEDKSIDNYKMKILLVNFLEINISEFNQRNRSNDQKAVLENLLLEVYFFYYFKKFQIRCVFNLEKILALSTVKMNKIIYVRLMLYKLEIINSFLIIHGEGEITKNKNDVTNEELTSPNETSDTNFIKKSKAKNQNKESTHLKTDYDIQINFNQKHQKSGKKLYVNFFHFYEYKRVQSKNEECFKNFKALNQKFYLLEYFFPEFIDDINALLESLSECNFSINQILKNYKHYSSLYLKNMAIYSKFFYDENIYQRIYPNRNLQDDFDPSEISNEKCKNKFLNIYNNYTEKIILKQNNKQKLIFEKVTPNFCNQLGFTSKELLSKELDDILPCLYRDFHNTKIQNFINKNQLIIKNKEVFFISKLGYCINYKLNCAIILTLAEEILFYCELQIISDLNANFSETAFLQCSSDGFVIAYDIGIKNHLFLDSYLINLIKLNLFKNLLCLNKQALDKLSVSKENYENFKVSYLDILKNIKLIDFLTIIEQRTQEQNNFIFLKRLNNAINYDTDGDCIIEIFKRHVNKDVVLFDVRFDFAKITKVNFKLDIANLVFLQENRKDRKKKETNLVPINVQLKIVQKQNIFNKKFIKNVRYITYNFKNNPGLMLKNLNIVEELSIEFATTESPIESAQLYTSIVKYFKQNKIKIEEKKIKICFWNRFVCSFIFLGMFIAIYYQVNVLNDGLYEKARNFVDFSFITIMLKYYTVTLSHSYFSINLIISGLELPNFSYMSNNFENSIDYHFNLLKERSDNFLENAYKFQNLYNTHGSYLLDSNDTIYENFAIAELNSDWSASQNVSFNMLQNMYLFHYIADRTEIQEIYNTNFNLFNNTLNNLQHYPTKTDKTLFFFMENIVGKLNVGYNKIIESAFVNFSNYISTNKIYVFLLYLLSGVFGIVYIAVETYILNSAHNQIYMKFFVVYNQLKLYHSILIKKVDLIEEIFTDFTEEALNNLKRNRKLLKIKLYSETIRGTGDMQEKKVIAGKTGENRDNSDSISNENGYFKGYSIMSKGAFENSLNNSPFVSNSGGNYMLKPNKKVNSILFKVLSSYKEKVKNRNALKYMPSPKNSNNNLNESKIKKVISLSSKNVLDFKRKEKNEGINYNSNAPDNKYLKINDTNFSNLNNIDETQQLKSIQFNAITNNINIDTSNLNNNSQEPIFVSQNNMKVGLFFDKAKHLSKKNSKANIENGIFPSNLSVFSENKLISEVTNTTDKPTESTKSNKILRTNKHLSKNKRNSNRNINLNLEKQNEPISLNDHYRDISNKKYINEEDLVNSEKVIIQKNYFGKSTSYLIFFRILLLGIFLILITSIVVFTFVVSAYDRIFSNYQTSRSFLMRSEALNELTLIYRYSLINKKIAYGNYTYSEVNLFQQTLERYKTYFAETKIFVDKNDNEFFYLKNFEKNMKSKDMCNYYAFYMTEENTTKVENYSNYLNDCNKISGGLNTFGIENSFESMVFILNGLESDLDNYIENSKDQILDNEHWFSYIENKLSEESFLKTYKNINTILFDVNQLIFKYINDFNDYFFDDLALKHDWVHYMLFLIVGLSNYYFLFLVYFFIEKPKAKIIDSENLVRNSILFDICES